MRTISLTRVGGASGHLAPRLVELFPRLSRADQELALTLYRLLGTGHPVSVPALAEATGREAARIEAVLAGWPGIERNESGITGFRGLSLEPTRHALHLPGRTVYGWCAWDTLFLPELLEASAEVASTCPATGRTVTLEVGPDGVHRLAPAGALLSMILPKREMMDDLRRLFCAQVHFLATEAAAREWEREHHQAVLVTVHEAFKVGHHVNHGRFHAVLGPPGE